MDGVDASENDRGYVSYGTRNDAFSPSVTYSLESDRLLCHEAGKPPRAFALSDVREVQLDFAPTRFERRRYRCGLCLRNGARIEFFNRTYRGVADFQDTSAEYAAFVRALHEALARQNTGCQFVAGVSASRYVVNLLALIFAGLAVVAAAVFFVLVGLVWIVLFKVLVILFFLPTGLRWLRRNQPRRYDPRAIPAEVLPQTS